MAHDHRQSGQNPKIGVMSGLETNQPEFQFQSPPVVASSAPHRSHANASQWKLGVESGIYFSAYRLAGRGQWSRPWIISALRKLRYRCWKPVDIEGFPRL